MNSGLYVREGSSATAWHAAWANWFELPTTKVSKVWRDAMPLGSGAGGAGRRPRAAPARARDPPRRSHAGSRRARPAPPPEGHRDGSGRARCARTRSARRPSGGRCPCRRAGTGEPTTRRPRAACGARGPRGGGTTASSASVRRERWRGPTLSAQLHLTILPEVLPEAFRRALLRHRFRFAIDCLHVVSHFRESPH